MNYAGLLSSDVKLIDLRSPGEFEKGAFPNSINLPLLDDEQRRLVGLEYKQNGQHLAIERGHQLIHPELKASRIEQWLSAVRQHPGCIFYCWRGGLRSNIVQQWLSDTGHPVSIIEGGYKALRNQCLDCFEKLPVQQKFLILAGRTGSGKTILLNSCSNSVDLEGFANHRGSAFGRKSSEQPTTINFEHQLARRLMQLQAAPLLVLEDESRIIGRLAIPHTLFNTMLEADVVVLESPLEDRSERIYQEYVVAELSQQDITAEHLQARYLAAVQRIKRRLGNLRCTDISENLRDAFALRPGDSAHARGHKVWIEKLLKGYYDPMYDYQLSRKQSRVIKSGSCNTIREYLLQRGG